MPQFGASLKIVIYDRNIFIIQATDIDSFFTGHAVGISQHII
jgi:hypothetical protein